MKPLRWGVLGATGHIASRVVPAIHRTAGNAVVAVASRAGRRAKAEEVARPFGARVHDGYDELLADPETLSAMTIETGPAARD